MREAARQTCNTFLHRGVSPRCDRTSTLLADPIASLTGEVRAVTQRLPGLQHNHLGIDRAAGTVAAVSVWDCEEHANFSREALGDPISGLRALGVQFELPEIYEIMDGAG